MLPTRYIAAAVCLLLAVTAANSQINTLPTPTPPPSLREIEENAKRDAVPPGERRPKRLTKSERREIAAETAVVPAVYEKYRGLLKKWGKDGGLVRLFPDFDCETKGLLRVDGDCAKHIAGRSRFGFSGSGGPRFHLNNGRIVSEGVLVHTLFTDLGASALEDIVPATAGIAALSTYVPADDFPRARKQFRDIRTRPMLAGIMISDSVEATPGRVYAVRTIAFRSGIFDAPWRYGVKQFTPLEIDLVMQRWTDRLDVTGVFSIVDVAEDGSVHVLWRRFSKERAPKLHFEKPTPEPVFR